MDVYFLYKRLLPEYAFPAKWFSQPRSSSALIFYWAMDRVFPDVITSYSIHYTKLYEEALEKSRLPILVDILDWAGIPEDFRREILRGKVEVVQQGKTVDEHG